MLIPEGTIIEEPALRHQETQIHNDPILFAIATIRAAMAIHAQTRLLPPKTNPNAICDAALPARIVPQRDLQPYVFLSSP